MRILIIGATSALAHECARGWASKGECDFILIGRNSEALAENASDLAVRFPKSQVEVKSAEFSDASSLLKAIESSFDVDVDVVFIAHGQQRDQRILSANPQMLYENIAVTSTSVAYCAEISAYFLERQGHGVLAVVSSVAGDRGRAYNYAYGAAKALVSTYVSGLQQRFAKSPVAICLIKPGPISSPMTANHGGKMSQPDTVASGIIEAIGRKKRVAYVPGIWRFVMLAVRFMPFWLYKRMSF